MSRARLLHAALLVLLWSTLFVLLGLALTSCVTHNHILVPDRDVLPLPLELNTPETDRNIKCYQPLGQQCVRKI